MKTLFWLVAVVIVYPLYWDAVLECLEKSF